MQTRSRSKSPDSRPPATTPTHRARKATATPALATKDATDQLPPHGLTALSASGSDRRLTDRLVDQQLETIAERMEANLRRKKDLDDEMARDRASVQLLLEHPQGELPEAVVTSAAASALQAADEEKRRREAAEETRRQSDIESADKARRDRLRDLMLRSSALPDVATVARRARPESGSPERQRPLKVTRFALHQPQHSDSEEEELSILPVPESRPEYLNRVANLLLYLAKSTCTHCPPVIPSLRQAHTLTYAAALAHVSSQLRLTFGADRPSFHSFLLILRELPQFCSVLFSGSPDKEALATMALTTWLRLFNDQLTRLLRLADNHRPYVDAQFEVFASRLESADPTVFDPVALIKRHVDKLAVALTESRSKQLLKFMFPAPAQSTPQHQPHGGKGAGGKGSGKGSGGKGKGGKGNQQHAWPPPPGLPGQDWSDHFWMYIRLPRDAHGSNLRTACYKCGGGSAPGSTNHHMARYCNASDAQVQDWVRNMKPVQ